MGTYKLFERVKRSYSVDYYFNDHLLPSLSGNAVKVLLTIMRWTPDQGVEWAELSYADIREATGIGSDATVSKAVKQLLDFDAILVKDPAKNWDKNSYAINRDAAIEISTTETVEPSTTETVEPSTTETVESVIYNINNNNKDLDNRSNRTGIIES